MNTTYADHYQWRKMRANRKDKFVSPYGQKSLRQKNQETSKPTNEIAEKFQHDEQIFSRVASVKKTDDIKRPPTPELRPATSKSAPAVLEEVQAPKSSAKSRRSSSHRSVIHVLIAALGIDVVIFVFRNVTTILDDRNFCQRLSLLLTKVNRLFLFVSLDDLIRS